MPRVRSRGNAMMNRLLYWQVWQLTHVSELLLGACLSRLAERMFALAIILYALDRFGSPVLPAGCHSHVLVRV
jgi:hypothetical protein